MTREQRIEEAATEVLIILDADGYTFTLLADEKIAALRAALAAPDHGEGAREGDEADIALTLAGADLAATIAHAECLEIAERWAAQYPTDVFLPDGTSIEARAAHHARRVAGLIAEDIRKLVVENRPAAPALPLPEAPRATGERIFTTAECPTCGTEVDGIRVLVERDGVLVNPPAPPSSEPRRCPSRRMDKGQWVQCKHTEGHSGWHEHGTMLEGSLSWLDAMPAPPPAPAPAPQSIHVNCKHRGPVDHTAAGICVGPAPAPKEE